MKNTNSQATKYLSGAAVAIFFIILVLLISLVAEGNEFNNRVETEPTNEVTEEEIDKADSKMVNWKLVAFIKGGSSVTIPDGVTLNTQANDFSGNAGCNNYFGSFEASDNDSIVVSPIGSTQMFCEGTMDFETSYLATLQQVTSMRSTAENKMTLYSGVEGQTALDYELVE